MTATEKIQGLIEDMHQEIRKSTIADILIDLRWCLESAPGDQKDGLQAAIEMIESNY